MNKEELYKQIENFNKQLTNPSVRSSESYEKAYLYVDNKNAEDKAKFVNFLIEREYISKSHDSVLDLAFGSGNLTSHIIFDNDIEYKTLYLNDLNKKYINQKIIDYIDNSSISSYDMLNSKNFQDKKADLVIVNPQIGGNYTDGDILQQKEEDETQQDVLNRLGKTLKNFINNNATVLFYGKEKDLKSILPHYKYIKYNSKMIDIFVLSSKITETLCFEKSGNKFIKCKNYSAQEDKIESFDDIEIEAYKDSKEDKKEKFVSDSIDYNFPHKNLLLKGVPGTGKSRAIENIINKKLNLKDHKKNILRINIHSASSNADLMQGIGISSKDGQIEYKEKQGLILNLIERATFHPNQPFVLILEEIQENSLNELIGDLIYLIEDDKRAKDIVADDKEYNYQELVEKIIKANPQTSYVEIPYLVNDSTKYRKMIMPDNLYIFCTSNYRDDKKVIEDNLLRRFEVLEIYPKDSVVHEYCKEFFSQLNKNILEVMKDEIHPDRFLIGHSNWLEVDDKEKFYRAFLKVVVEFKDIKEVEFSDFKEIVEKLPLVDELDLSSYKALIEDLQTKAGYDFLD